MQYDVLQITGKNLETSGNESLLYIYFYLSLNCSKQKSDPIKKKAENRNVKTAFLIKIKKTLINVEARPLWSFIFC